MKRILIILLVLAPLMTIASLLLAQTGGDYDLTWSTVYGGGGASTGGGYTLNGTPGQPDAGWLNGGTYTLSGGFWFGTAANRYIYLPLVLKN